MKILRKFDSLKKSEINLKLGFGLYKSRYNTMDRSKSEITKNCL